MRREEEVTTPAQTRGMVHKIRAIESFRVEGIGLHNTHTNLTFPHCQLSIGKQSGFGF